tara:strand:+ start:161 stop:898 length:738 start_codon:yes stop_codon:yes gene_type:complete
MKKVLFILYCLPILFIGCSSQDTYIDPIKYNDALVEQQVKVIQKMSEITSQENTTQMKSLLPELQAIIDTSLLKLEKITFFQDDYGLKKSFTEQMEFYNREMIPFMNRLIDISDELSETDWENFGDDERFTILMTQYTDLLDEGSVKEKPYDEAVEKAQNKFSQVHGFGIENNPYNAELDSILESNESETWNELIEGCVDGNEEIREFCECMISNIKKDYTIESILTLSTEEMEKIGSEYSIYCQ